jgi:hypothetical protein
MARQGLGTGAGWARAVSAESASIANKKKCFMTARMVGGMEHADTKIGICARQLPPSSTFFCVARRAFLQN